MLDNTLCLLWLIAIIALATATAALAWQVFEDAMLDILFDREHKQ